MFCFCIFFLPYPSVPHIRPSVLGAFPEKTEKCADQPNPRVKLFYNMLNTAQNLLLKKYLQGIVSAGDTCLICSVVWRLNPWR